MAQALEASLKRLQTGFRTAGTPLGQGEVASNHAPHVSERLFLNKVLGHPPCEPQSSRLSSPFEFAAARDLLADRVAVKLWGDHRCVKG